MNMKKKEEKTLLLCEETYQLFKKRKVDIRDLVCVLCSIISDSLKKNYKDEEQDWDDTNKIMIAIEEQVYEELRNRRFETPPMDPVDFKILGRPID